MTRIQGHKEHEHRILIIDDEASVGKAIGRILDTLKLKFTYAKTGEAGLKSIDNTETPFSLIICDQQLPGIKGTQFLARAKEISTETIRFLITGYSQMDTITAAVNKGAVQHYISKPWNHDDMVKAIQSGILLYERHLESEQLFILAKKQNAKLYELNCELMETAKLHENELEQLESQIKRFAEQLSEKTGKSSLTPSQVMDRMISFITAGETDKEMVFKTLCENTISSLYREFSDLSLRNGIEMPEPGTGGSND